MKRSHPFIKLIQQTYESKAFPLLIHFPGKWLMMKTHQLHSHFHAIQKFQWDTLKDRRVFLEITFHILNDNFDEIRNAKFDTNHFLHKELPRCWQNLKEGEESEQWRLMTEENRARVEREKNEERGGAAWQHLSQLTESSSSCWSYSMTVWRKCEKICTGVNLCRYLLNVQLQYCINYSLKHSHSADTRTQTHTDAVLCFSERQSQMKNVNGVNEQAVWLLRVPPPASSTLMTD